MLPFGRMFGHDVEGRMISGGCSGTVSFAVRAIAPRWAICETEAAACYME